ncbi:MAG: hypothetical protein V2I35_14305 [Desulfocapsaceae bacterium]|nr:hypothetical protein [Desulfocapsaceae bacterium]
MTIEDPLELNFLGELYRKSEGNPARQVSMYEIGDVLGLDKNSAGALAEELIVGGYAELVSLSGGIAITADGLRELNVSPETSFENVNRLGNEKHLTPEGIAAVEEVLNRIKRLGAGTGFTYLDIEEIVIDIKTAEIQLLSSKVKTAIIREILKSLQDTLEGTEDSEVTNQIRSMLQS